MILKHKRSRIVEFVLSGEAAETPHLMGSWDGWSLPGIPMLRKRGPTASWHAEVELSAGEHQFRYRIGSDWINDSSADRYVDNGFWGENSVVIVEAAPGEVPRGGEPKPEKRPPAEKGVGP